MSGRVILNADDYGLSAGVSRAIAALARARRISSASAIVTRPGWSNDAVALGELRDLVAIGLHINLTVGAPLGPMPRFAPSGEFEGLLRLIALIGAVQAPYEEIRSEINRQIDAFYGAIGAAPDAVDGHQHVHALPGIRRVLIKALNESGVATSSTLLRDPADKLRRICRRPRGILKAVASANLAAGFGATARRLGYVTNVGFSGFSNFDADAAAVDADFASASRAAGPLHMIMAHPGHSDDDLARMDRHLKRRDLEFDFLMRNDDFNSRIWRPTRQDTRISWPARLDRDDAL